MQYMMPGRCYLLEELTGVLLDRRVLFKALRGRPVFERVDLYAAAAKELGCKVVLFNASSIDFKSNSVIGYVPDEDGTFQRTRTPIPRVIHNRSLISRRPAGLKILQRLARRGIRVFNPVIDHDKYNMHKLLYRNAELRPYLPESVPLTKRSWPWFKSKLLTHGEIFLKPRRGSLGWGIVRVRRLRSGKYRYEGNGVVRTGSLLYMWRLARTLRRRRYLLQVGIDLAQIGRYRFDLRVPVQRDASGNWRVPGMAAKRSESHPFLTNIAQGGSALKLSEAIRQGIPGADETAIRQEVEKLARTVAETLSTRYPGIADIGLDIGLDKQGTPYLIEVNRRDLRIILSQAGENDVYAEMYRNPLAYAMYLAQVS